MVEPANRVNKLSHAIGAHVSALKRQIDREGKTLWPRTFDSGQRLHPSVADCERVATEIHGPPLALKIDDPPDDRLFFFHAWGWPISNAAETGQPMELSKALLHVECDHAYKATFGKRVAGANDLVLVIDLMDAAVHEHGYAAALGSLIDSLRAVPELPRLWICFLGLDLLGIPLRAHRTEEMLDHLNSADAEELQRVLADYGEVAVEFGGAAELVMRLNWPSVGYTFLERQVETPHHLAGLRGWLET